MKRKVPLVKGGIYHVFNRGVEKRDIFLEASFYSRFLDVLRHTLKYDYPYSLLKRRLGETASSQARKAVLEQLKTRIIDPSVEIISFCLMPNHFHFALRQLVENGITNFLRRICTSYAKYFNTRLDRVGGLFQGRFKAVLVESDEQLIHLTRYHHINPWDLGLERAEELVRYPWSSLAMYLGEREADFVNPEPVLSNFSSGDEYLEFTIAEIDEFEPLRLETVAIDDDLGWFRRFKDLKKEQKKRLQEQYIETLSQRL